MFIAVDTANMLHVSVDELDHALSQHRQWKSRLIRDADRGSTLLDPDIVREDHHCEVGKWIRSGLPPTLALDPRFERVKAYHSRFHIHAADIVLLIRSGKSDTAKLEMERGPYATLTLQLVRELSLWIAELRTAPPTRTRLSR